MRHGILPVSFAGTEDWDSVSSWADSLPMIWKRHPHVADAIMLALVRGGGGVHIEAARHCREWGLMRQSGRTLRVECDRGTILSWMTGHDCPRKGGNNSLQRPSKPALSSSICRCGRPLDSRGHHRAACSVAGERHGFAERQADE